MRSSAKAIRRTDAPPSKNCTPRTAPFFSPWAVTSAAQALDQVAGELRAGHPSFVYIPHSTPQAVQDAGRIAWGSGPAGGPPRYTGLDVIIVRDGKIAALYVFLEPRPYEVDTAIDDDRGWMRNLVIGSRRRLSAGSAGSVARPASLI